MWQPLTITHSPQGGNCCPGNTLNTQRQPQTFGQPSEWLSGEQLTPTHRHMSVSAPQPRPRPSITLSPYERQIVRAISGGAERLQSCSGVMEEVAAHRQALLAASHTLLSPPLIHLLHLAFNLRGFYFPSELYVVSCKPLLHLHSQHWMHLWAPHELVIALPW